MSAPRWLVLAGTLVLSANLSCKFELTPESLSRLHDDIKSANEELTSENEYYVGRAVATNLLARNEYKYYADVVTDLGEIPRLECWVDDLNQVFLNLIVNGAHAIHDRLGESGGRGTLTISSRIEEDTVPNWPLLSITTPIAFP